jgi:hypothetical protein
VAQAHEADACGQARRGKGDDQKAGDGGLADVQQA